VKRMRWLALLLAVAAGPSLATVPEPQDYRGPPYLGEVPATLQGAQVIDGTAALGLHAAGVPFLDVYPATRRPEGLPPGTLWRQPRHDSVPGAIWLPDVGYEMLNPQEQARLEDGLATVTQGDRTKPVVIFCRADCWLSWNAARRAVGLGYSAVYWFPKGVEGWGAAGGTLAPIALPPD